MSRALPLLALALLAAGCGGEGCAAGPSDRRDGSAESFSGGGGSRGGSLSEPASFGDPSGMAKGGPAKSTSAPAAPDARAAAARKAAEEAVRRAAPQAIVCRGFPGLPKDCLRDERLEAIRRKCCPDGVVEACEGVRDGAKLSGRACFRAR